MPAPLAVDPTEFRRVVARFATGVTVVGLEHGGAAHAMTVNSFASVSLEPLLVLFCVEKIARFHDPVMAATDWAVSVLGADQEHASRWFATRGRPEDQQLEGYRTRPAVLSAAPVLTDAIAVIECRTWARYEGGDHTIVVGEVLWVEATDGPRPPLVYYDGRYTTAPEMD